MKLLGRSRVRETLACALTISVCAAAPHHSFAQEASRTDEVLVTASRLETRESTSASSFTVLDHTQLEDSQNRFVSDALKQAPGVDIVRSGGPGGNSSAFLRGGNTEHTLVLLDGIELNNPASTARAFNLATLTLENVERIEIVPGPQSTVYGSDALGGVINIISKRAKPGLAASVRSEAGSYDTFTQLGDVAWGGEDMEVTAGVTRQDVGGISAASARDGNGEHDGLNNTSLSARARFFPSPLVDGGMTVRFNDGGSDLDNTTGPGGDDPNRRLRTSALFTQGEASTHFLGGALSQKATAAYTRQELRDDNNPDSLSSEFLRSRFSGDLFKLSVQNTWKPSSLFAVVGGLETERERADSTYRSDGAFGPFEDDFTGRTVRTNAAFAESRLSLDDRAFLDAGIRVNHHAIFGSATTYRIAPAVLLDDETKLRASVGSGFKAPSLVQLYSSFGNEDLDPERSLGWEVGIDRKLARESVSVSATYFRNSFDDLISFNPSTFVLENVNEATTSGFELSGSAELNDSVTLRGNYTYTDTEDETTGLSLLRRPRNKGTLTIVYALAPKLRAQAQARLFGRRFDNDFSGPVPERVTLGGYGLVDLSASYDLTERIELFARVENVFDRAYEEVSGYGTMGLAAYGGVKVSF